MGSTPERDEESDEEVDDKEENDQVRKELTKNGTHVPPLKSDQVKALGRSAFHRFSAT